MSSVYSKYITTEELEKRILKALEKYRYGALRRYVAEDIGAENAPNYLRFCKELDRLTVQGFVIYDENKDGYILPQNFRSRKPSKKDNR